MHKLKTENEHPNSFELKQLLTRLMFYFRFCCFPADSIGQRITRAFCRNCSLPLRPIPWPTGPLLADYHYGGRSA